MTKTPRPKLLVSADWSTNENKRWMVRAELEEDRYRIYPPEPVGEVKTLIERLRAQVSESESALIGFDFPIGLPQKYAELAKFTSFHDALNKIGKGDWLKFYDISDKPSLYQPFAPLPQVQPGFKKNDIPKAFGLNDYRELLRQCDKKTSQRNEAEILFFTLGGKQVGAGARIGWRDVIAPKCIGTNPIVRLWPFDGKLEELLARPGLTVCETYPGETYHHLGIRIGSGTGKSKTKREDRKEFSKTILNTKDEDFVFTNAAVSWIEYGFLEEDDFDAMVALLSMIQVVTGKREPGVPPNGKETIIEGWILGLQAESQDATSSSHRPKG